MPTTTVHVPDRLLRIVDSRARAEGISRNRLILRALERLIEEDETWSPDFLAELRRAMAPADADALDIIVKGVVAHRSRKRPPAL